MADPERKAIPGDAEDTALEQMGYQPGKLILFGLKYSGTRVMLQGELVLVQVRWSALGGVLVTGVNAGGPPVMIWGWVGISLVSLCVAYSMAEMCSEYPVAGGQYSWVYILSPKSIRRQFSYLTGWFMIIVLLTETGILAMGATNSFIGANFILGQANLVNPNYEIQRWHTVLVAYSITLFATFINMWGSKILDKISKGLLIFNILSFISIVVTILACNTNKQSASFVFRDFQNFTGFSTSMAGIIGILQPAFGMCCYDAPAHMCEELKDASKQAPRAMVLSVYIGSITGFIFLIAVCFCIGDITEVAETATLVPLIQIFFDSTNSNVGSCILATLIVIIDLGCANALLAEGARSLYAFARDHGLPFSSFISKVEPKHQIPVVAIILGTVVQMAFNITSENMNYTSAAVGVIMLVAAITWFTTARKRFSGPEIEAVINIITGHHGSDSEDVKGLE
ncbi:Choline transport protein [Lachnellula suecica]|uniref:Choline transport protein n=1 Tax=Lachnellula suecica TaxID=602035 RepID=A0A8T9C8R2_9HELO|nr:Choline transport protein [Lachnellula suecica]